MDSRTKEVNAVFVRRILKDEWERLKQNQDKAIAAALKPQTGKLHKGSGRKYFLRTHRFGGVASLVHVDYERFQDMHRLKRGRQNVGSEPITRRKGKQIHNKWIWGRMNSIAFRVSMDLKQEVIKSVRVTYKKKSLNKDAVKMKNVTINT